MEPEHKENFILVDKDYQFFGKFTLALEGGLEPVSIESFHPDEILQERYLLGFKQELFLANTLGTAAEIELVDIALEILINVIFFI